MPEDLQRLPALLTDTYFCNLSIFQSMPDSWAIDQIFPITPISRLNEEPTRRVVLADITCDSDGKIDRFPDLRDVKRYLPAHDLREGERYYFAAFLVGAYQEILGDLHNLFGDTNAVHVEVRRPRGLRQRAARRLGGAGAALRAVRQGRPRSNAGATRWSAPSARTSSRPASPPTS